MAHIHKTVTIHASIDKVYPYARDPEHWSDWWVGLRQADSITGFGGPGTEVLHHYKLAGISFPVTSKVLEDRIGRDTAHWKGEFSGPLNGKHEWNYKQVGDDTEVTVDLDYAIPGKALGRFADKLLVEKLQENAIDHTLTNLKTLCEAGVMVPAHA